MLALMVGLAGGLICSIIASGKRRNRVGWFVIGFLLPLIGVILLLVLPPGAGGLDPDAALLVPSPPPPAPDPQQARLAALERLAALRDRGVLTDDELEEQKRAILAGQPSTSARTGDTVTCPMCQRQVDRARTVITGDGVMCDRCHAAA